jgi:hypothetical protein
MAVQDNGDDTSVAKAQAIEGPGPQPSPPTPASSAAPERPKLILRIHRAVKEIEPWGILVAVVALVLSLITTWSDYSDRVEERTVRAWQLLTTQAPGNSGKIAALEYLNREDGFLCADLWGGCLISIKGPVPLAGIDLSPPNPEDNGTPGDPTDDPPGGYLVEIDLRDANLGQANLRRVNLNGAKLNNAELDGGVNLTDAILYDVNLTDAKLNNVNLTDAKLSGANLTRANLWEANLTRAKLWNANLTDANLDGAVLRGVDLTDVSGLTQGQLSGACGDKDTKLPADLTIPLCPQKPAP